MRRILMVSVFVLITASFAHAQSVAVDLVARFGRGYAQMAAWSPDGSRLAIATSIGVWVYDSTNWDTEPHLFETDYFATWTEFSPRGGLLAVGLGDGTAQAFDVETGEWLDRIIGGPIPERGAMANFNVPAKFAHFVPATDAPGQTSQGTVSTQVVNDADGSELRLKVTVFIAEAGEHPAPSLISPDGVTRVDVTRDRVVLFDPAANAPLRDLHGYSLPILNVGFSALGDSIIAEQLGGTARVYDALTGTDLGQYPTIWPSTTSTMIAADPISQRTAIAIRSRGIQVIDPVLGPVTLAGRDASVTSLAFEPGGERLAAGFSDGTLRIYDDYADATAVRDAYAAFGHVLDIVWILDSAYLVTAGEEGRLKLWAADEPVLADSQMFGSHANEATALAVSPLDPTLFASASLDGTVRLWRLDLRK